MRKDYTYTPPPYTHRAGGYGRRSPDGWTGPRFSYRLVWEVAAVAAAISLIIVLLFLTSVWDGMIVTVGFLFFLVLLFVIDVIFLATGSEGTVEVFVTGQMERIRRRLDNVLRAEGLTIVWKGARHGDVYPVEVIDHHASGTFKERRLASISLAEMSRGRIAVRLVYRLDIVITGLSGLRAEHRRFTRITSNLKSRLGTTVRGGSRRPPEPPEDPVIRYIPDKRMYSIGKNVYCPMCGYEFTAHSVARSPRVGRRWARCPQCHERFRYSMDSREKRRPRRVQDPRLARPAGNPTRYPPTGPPGPERRGRRPGYRHQSGRRRDRNVR